MNMCIHNVQMYVRIYTHTRTQTYKWYYQLASITHEQSVQSAQRASAGPAHNDALILLMPPLYAFLRWCERCLCRCVCVCLRSCVRACVRACLCVCVRARACARAMVWSLTGADNVCTSVHMHACSHANTHTQHTHSTHTAQQHTHSTHTAHIQHIHSTHTTHTQHTHTAKTQHTHTHTH